MVLFKKVALAYLSGIVAAFSPCVIVLIPLLLYRFLGSRKKSPEGEFNSSKKALGPIARFLNRTWSRLLPSCCKSTYSADLQTILLFVLGFQVSYLIFGYCLGALLTSAIQNGVKMGMGCLFCIFSVLALADRMDPLSMPMFDNTLYMGVSFALLLSFNPCTVPFLAVIISLNTTDALFALFAFGNGLLTPALICVFVSQGFTKAISRKSGGAMHRLNKAMSVVLGVAGLYILWSVPSLTGLLDLLVALVLLWISTIVTAQSFNVIGGDAFKNLGAFLFGASAAAKKNILDADRFYVDTRSKNSPARLLLLLMLLSVNSVALLSVCDFGMGLGAHRFGVPLRTVDSIASSAAEGQIANFAPSQKQPADGVEGVFEPWKQREMRGHNADAHATMEEVQEHHRRTALLKGTTSAAAEAAKKEAVNFHTETLKRRAREVALVLEAAEVAPLPLDVHSQGVHKGESFFIPGKRQAAGGAGAAAKQRSAPVVNELTENYPSNPKLQAVVAVENIGQRQLLEVAPAHEQSPNEKEEQESDDDDENEDEIRCIDMSDWPKCSVCNVCIRLYLFSMVTWTLGLVAFYKTEAHVSHCNKTTLLP